MNTSSTDRSYTWQMAVCGALLVITTLTNKGWIAYIPGITFGGDELTEIVAGLLYKLGMIWWCVRLFLEARRRLVQRQFSAGTVVATVFWVLAWASLFSPSRAELSYRLWRDDFHALVRSSIAQYSKNPDTDIAMPADRPWRFGHKITVSGTFDRQYETGLSLDQAYHVVVFDYGYAVDTLVFNSDNRPVSHETSGLCYPSSSDGGVVGRLEKNWFLCRWLGPE